MARLWSKDKLFLSYLAGFIDGEGTVGVSRRNRYGLTYSKQWYCYDPYVSISNTDLPILDYIQGRLGFGSVRGKFQNGNHYGNKPKYSFWTSNRNARILLTSLEPYLRVKKEQAQLVIAMPKRGGSLAPIVDKERRAKQEATYWKLRKIHAYGEFAK